VRGLIELTRQESIKPDALSPLEYPRVSVLTLTTCNRRWRNRSSQSQG